MQENKTNYLAWLEERLTGVGPGLLSGETGCPYHCPCLSSPSPLQALSSLAGLSNSWTEEAFSED